MTVAIIVPYFGRLPNYFQLFLDSCGRNPEFDWIIFSNDTTEYAYPPNVHFREMTFEACCEKIQERFDFTVSLNTPQKLCDFKCAYGYIFEDILAEYDWWGHCDLDQIFGRLGDFITVEMLNAYDKIGSLGHLTLYRNTRENNRVFMSTDRYRSVFTTETGCAFDEWLPDNINEVYLASGRKMDLNNPGADINAYRTTFQTVEFKLDGRYYEKSPVTNSIFLWDKGRLTQIFEGGTREYPYVHLQKRKMTDARGDKAADKFYIVPNCFVDGTADPVRLLKTAKGRGLVNTQFFTVKWKSLKYRIRSGDWKFSSVFKK